MLKIGSLAKDADMSAKRVKQDEPKAGRVQVLVRMRPALEDEQGAPEADLSMCEESSTINMTHLQREYTFAADRIFGPQSTQKEVYESGGVREVVASVMEGKNACVFAYGNTGTGKTFTMQGAEGGEKGGVIPFAVRQVLEKAKTLSKGGMATCVVTMSLLEIYNDKLRDLMLPPTAPPPAKELAIREDHEGTICVPGLTERAIQSYEEFESLYTRASASRKTSATQLNVQSSRSHAVLMIKVLQTFEKGVSKTGSGRMGMAGSGNNNQNRTLGTAKANGQTRTVVGKLNLIDLAGSERNSKTGNRGERLQESQNINLSLFVLSKVIDGLNQGDSRIPYRDSKLTRLLQDSLNPHSASSALMICCIAPSAAMASETCQSLTYASKARSISSVPKALHPGNEPPPTPSRYLLPRAPLPTSTTKPPSTEPLKARLDKWRVSSASKPAASSSSSSSSSFGPASRVSSTTTEAPPAPQPHKRKWDDKDKTDRPTASSTNTSSGSGSGTSGAMVGNKENGEPSGKAVAAGQGPVPSAKVPVTSSSSTGSGKSSSSTGSSVSSQGNESMVAAKDMIVQAKGLEKEERLAEALRLYEAAELLLPGHEKLKSRVAGLRDRIRQQRDKEAGIAEPMAVVREEEGRSMMDFADSPEDNAELLHSAVKERRERMMVSRDEAPPMMMDFGEDMEGEEEEEEEEERREWRAHGSMTPPIKIDPAAKEECLKSLHKEIKNVLEAEIVEILNTGTMKQLLKLSGIGKKRAEHIMQMRDEAEEAGGGNAFQNIHDLGKIGLTTVMIAKILKSNAMQRLEVTE